MLEMNIVSDDVGAAAHTGTAVGRAIELWHRGVEVNDALRQVKAESPGGDGRDPFLDYNEDEVQTMFRRYASDPRNDRGIHNVPVNSLEAEVDFELPPHPLNTTRQPIRITGHLDQIRIPAGLAAQVWDVKSGKSGGDQMLADYAFQIAAYTVGAHKAGTWGNVMPGGIIRLRGYMGRAAEKLAQGEHPVFFRYGMQYQHAMLLMEEVSLRVALMRTGEVCAKPGRFCSFCPSGGLDFCLQRLSEMAE